MKIVSAFLVFLFIPFILFAQNVGIGTTAAQARLHIQGSADTSQLVTDAPMLNNLISSSW